MGNVSGKDELDENGELDEDEGSVTSSQPGFAPPLPGHVSRTRSGGSPPASPGQSRSPRMFVPQTPVSPLLKPADPIFNQVLMKEDQDEIFDYPHEKEIPVLLVWTFGGKNVSVEGSWDHWKTRYSIKDQKCTAKGPSVKIILQDKHSRNRKSLQKSGKDFSILLALPSGVYRYRYVVDGERRCIPDLPNITDESGHVVNLLDVHDYVPENTERVSEFDPPSSPPASYGWVMPDDKEMSKDPPIVPPQLPNGFLGSHNSDEEDFPRPQHIVLNHLFIERGLVAQPIVALGLTHRFQSKYVTVVLYKPVER